MSQLVVCTVLDMVAKQYGRPFFTVSTGSAIRGFSDEVNTPHEQSVLYKHPNDFQLYCIGTWDDETGRFTLDDVPSLLVSGSQVRVREEATAQAPTPLKRTA